MQLWPDFTIPSLESISIGKSVFHEHFLFSEFGLNVKPLHSLLQLQNFLQLIRFSSLNCSSNPSFHSLFVSPWHIEPMVSLKPLQWRLILLIFFDLHVFLFIWINSFEILQNLKYESYLPSECEIVQSSFASSNKRNNNTQLGFIKMISINRIMTIYDWIIDKKIISVD